MLFLDKIKKEIDNATVVSFDIFDTLLVRPYLHPTDLFFHIEKVKNAPMFLNIRQEAERDARQNDSIRDDITFDEIYAEIDALFKPLKPVELEFEKMVLRANPELKQVYNYAKETGKKIVIASDMYLPTDFMAEVLIQNGFNGWDKLYISGDLGKTKASGKMFRLIMNDFPDVAPKKILHIGDNAYSDYKKPKEMGLSAVLYTQVIKQFFKAYPHLRDFAKSKGHNLGVSILLALLAHRWQNLRCEHASESNYWHKIGYWYAGPVAYGYSRFIEKAAIENNLDFLCFIARDGYTLQRVFNTFNTSIPNKYIYAPRLLNLICRLDYDHKSVYQTSAIIQYFSDTDTKIKELFAKETNNSVRSQHAFIQQHKELFVPHAQKNLDNYKKYIQTQTPKNCRAGVVDTITEAFSSQKLLQSVLDKPLHGLYWGVLRSPSRGTYERSCLLNAETTYNDVNVYTRNWPFMEFLLSSPEYPIKNMHPSGDPIYDITPDNSEQYRAAIYPTISDAAVEFATQVREQFNGHDIFLTGEDLVQYINVFIENPTATDFKEMAKIKFAVDHNHTQYTPLFVSDVSLAQMIMHPNRSSKVIKKTVWKTLPQNILICILKPLRIKIKKFQKVCVAVFPYLKRQYFKVSLTISPKCYYKFIIGHYED